MTGTATPRRPGDRKRQLSEVAASLFLEHGYHGVGVNDIARAAGISGPALYRHFTSKQELLAHVLLDALGQVHGTADRTLDGEAAPSARLGEFATALAEIAVEQRGISALWRWEGRHLTASDHQGVRDSAQRVMTRCVNTLRTARPGLATADAYLLCWAAMSVYGSVAVHRTSLAKRSCARLLADQAGAVLATELPAGTPPAAQASGPPTLGPAEPSGKREELLAAATTLFRRHGFHAVSVEEIGQAAGLAAASVYRHFPSKSAMLLAACQRMTERLIADAADAFDTTGDPATTLHRLIVSYVDAAAENRDLIAAYSTDIQNLPQSEQAVLRKVQREYVARWVELGARLRPEPDERRTRIAVHSALTIVNDLVRTPVTWQRPNLRAELVAVVRSVLGTQIPRLDAP